MFRERHLVPEGRLNHSYPVSAVPAGLTMVTICSQDWRPGLLSGSPFGAGVANPSFHADSLAAEVRLLQGRFGAGEAWKCVPQGLKRGCENSDYPAPNPDFLWNLVALMNFMRLSLLKGARAASSGAAWQEIRVRGWIYNGQFSRRL